MIPTRLPKYRCLFICLLALFGMARCAGMVRAAEPLTSLAAGSWNDWWINTNYSDHGHPDRCAGCPGLVHDQVSAPRGCEKGGLFAWQYTTGNGLDADSRGYF